MVTKLLGGMHIAVNLLSRSQLKPQPLMEVGMNGSLRPISVLRLLRCTNARSDIITNPN